MATVTTTDHIVTVQTKIIHTLYWREREKERTIKKYIIPVHVKKIKVKIIIKKNYEKAKER